MGIEILRGEIGIQQGYKGNVINYSAGIQLQSIEIKDNKGAFDKMLENNWSLY